jgi:CDP-diacylglycerol--glycerol-3-phosphate 3-phosphatidyltransferase
VSKENADIKSTAKHKPASYYAINAITMYRLAAAPILLLLVYLGYERLFKWFIAFSFFTDAIDGPLSRKYKVTSVFGARLDSVADDATVIVATIGLWFVHPDFIRSHWQPIAVLFGFFLIQVIAALVAFGKVTSFHTYAAKTAAVAQALFFFTIYFETPLLIPAFYLAFGITLIQLIEEVILVVMLPEWKSNVKGIYWVLKERSRPARGRKPAAR